MPRDKRCPYLKIQGHTAEGLHRRRASRALRAQRCVYTSRKMTLGVPHSQAGGRRSEGQRGHLIVPVSSAKVPAHVVHTNWRASEFRSYSSQVYRLLLRACMSAAVMCILKAWRVTMHSFSVSIPLLANSRAGGMLRSTLRRCPVAAEA